MASDRRRRRDPGGRGRRSPLLAPSIGGRCRMTDESAGRDQSRIAAEFVRFARPRSAAGHFRTVEYYWRLTSAWRAICVCAAAPAECPRRSSAKNCCRMYAPVDSCRRRSSRPSKSSPTTMVTTPTIVVRDDVAYTDGGPFARQAVPLLSGKWGGSLGACASSWR
uniref:Uncharacterized protein n=1 Tax=Plectus sambesii TaxID=2011161 RepID=A0A914UP22_9BILA